MILDTRNIKRIPSKTEENFSASGSPNVNETKGAFDNNVLAPNAIVIIPVAHNTSDEVYRRCPRVNSESSHKIKAAIIHIENVTSLPNSRPTGKGKNHNGIIATIIMSKIFAPYSNLSII